VRGTRKFTLTSLAVAVFAGLALAPSANAFDKGYLSVGVFASGPVKGLATLHQTGARTARGTVSLSGALGEGASDTVAWVKRPCSQSVASPAASTNEVAIESLELAHEGLSFVTRPIALKGTLSQIRSVRIWDDQGRQLACRAAQGESNEVMAAATFRRGLHGALAAYQRRAASRGKMYLSLGGLDPDSSYRVVGSEKPCGQTYTRSSHVFTTNVRPAANGFLQSIEFRGLRNTKPAKSLRVFGRTPGGPAVQKACAAYVIELEDILLS
jgi:hypothetical protein